MTPLTLLLLKLGLAVLAIGALEFYLMRQAVKDERNKRND